ncbi:MAG: serine hydrolase domain-containing protein [Vicinamibacterales bacterium]
MRTKRLVLSAFIILSLALSAGAQSPAVLTAPRAAQTAAPVTGLPPAAPESVGMSGPRLDRLKAVMQDYVDQGRIAGIATVVARAGKLVHLETYGRMDIEKDLPMRKDVILRMASMSKAVTTVAVAILLEEGRLLLTDPVSKYLPAFKQTTVAVPPPPGTPGAGRYGVVPAKRAINIRDLLTHTAGISYGQGSLAEAEYKAAGIFGWYLSDRKEPIVPLMERLAALPFDAQPGERFVYGYNTDILGAVVEKASGQPLDQFFKARIFDPLKMGDSAFFLPPDKRGRLATVYAAGPDGRVVRAPEGGTGQGDYVDGPRSCFGGGAGLLSTPMDYARFLQMLVNGGELDGVRILSPKSVELMTANHVGTLYNDGNMGFGLGFEVIEHLGRTGRYGTVGAYGWGSAYFQRFVVDPQEKLVAVFYAQLIPAGGLDIQEKWRDLVYAAIVGPPPAPATAPPGARR